VDGLRRRVDGSADGGQAALHVVADTPHDAKVQLELEISPS